MVIIRTIRSVQLGFDYMDLGQLQIKYPTCFLGTQNPETIVYTFTET